MIHELTPQELEDQTSRRLEALSGELGASVSPGKIHAVGGFHLERLRRQATVTDFIPLLVYRYAREELLYGEQHRLPYAA